MGVKAKIVVAVALAVLAGIVVWTALPKSRSVAVPAKVSCDAGVRAMAYDDEPERPLRRDGFDRLFQAGAAVRSGDKGAVVEVGDIAKLDLPTGRLVAGDPTYGSSASDLLKPFVVTVPPGSYPVSLARVRFDAEPTHTRVAAAKVLVRPEPVTRWELALVPGENPAKLAPNEFYGYGVDSGLGSFLDASAVPGLCRLMEDPDHSPLMNAIDGDTRMTGVSVRESATGPNVIAFSSGWGDGSYPTWIGYTAGGDVAQFVTDFSVID